MLRYAIIAMLIFTMRFIGCTNSNTRGGTNNNTMGAYYSVTELALLTGLHRQTVYMKVRKAYKEGSDLVKLDKAEGYKADKELFRKYLIDSNVEDVEEIKRVKEEVAAIRPAVIQLSERVYDDLVKERDALKEEVRTLYERVLDSERNYAAYKALYTSTEGKRLEVVNDPIERPISDPDSPEEESIASKKGKALKALKKPSYGMSDNMFYAVLISIAILGAVGLYIVEVL